MKVSKRKGHNPRYPVLKQALVFDGIMGPLITHLRAYNSAEISSLRRALNFVNHVVFEHVKSRVPLTSKPAPLDKLLTYNDTISWLKTRHTKMNKKIGVSKFGYQK